MKKELKNLGKAVGEFVVGCAACLLNAYVVTVLWSWFVVTVFGLPTLSIAAVLGLHLLYRMFIVNHRVKVEIVEDSLISLLALGVGYVIHLGM